MSQIVKKVDAKAAALIQAVDDGRGREGSSLMAPEDLEEDLNNVLKWMRGTRSVEGINMPRFGLLSLILQQTPIYVYGHPAFKKFSKTAFTDGMHIFISDDLYDKLNADVEANPSTFGVEWVILHEVMHKLFNHTRRLKHFPPDISNMATDLSINTKLVEGFPDLTACRSLKETGLGFKPGDKDRWIHLSEETIAMELMAERGLKKKRDVEQPPQNQQQKQQQGGQGNKKQDQDGQGQQQPGQGGGQGQQPGQGGGKGQQPGQGGGKGQQPGQGGQGGDQPGPQNDPLSELDGGQGGQGDPSEGGQGGQQPGQGGKGGQQPSGGQPGQQGGGGGQGDEEEMGGGQGGQGQGDDGDEKEPSENFGEEGDNHIVDPADLIRVMEENGMEAVRDKLNLPASDDVEAIGEMQEAARMRQAEAIMKAQADVMKHGGKYPGAHIVEAAGEMVKNFGKPKITWRLLAQDLVLGYSPKSAPTMEEPMELRYVPEMMDVLGMEPYLASILPHVSEEAVLFLVDTSGSMSNNAMRVALTEAIELKTAAYNMGDAASTVFIWPCDTVLRGKPIEINDGNVEDYITGGIEMKGRGGTSIDTCINQAMNSPLLADKKVKAIIYCSDLYDNPVPRPSSLEDNEDVRVLFLCDPETTPSAVETFAKGTPWADVSVIEDDLEVDFEMVNQGQQAVSPTNRSRKKKMR